MIHRLKYSVYDEISLKYSVYDEISLKYSFLNDEMAENENTG